LNDEVEESIGITIGNKNLLLSSHPEIHLHVGGRSGDTVQAFATKAALDRCVLDLLSTEWVLLHFPFRGATLAGGLRVAPPLAEAFGSVLPASGRIMA
jgi:hypothetical protein